MAMPFDAARAAAARVRRVMSRVNVMHAGARDAAVARDVRAR